MRRTTENRELVEIEVPESLPMEEARNKAEMVAALKKVDAFFVLGNTAHLVTRDDATIRFSLIYLKDDVSNLRARIGELTDEGRFNHEGAFGCMVKIEQARIISKVLHNQDL